MKTNFRNLFLVVALALSHGIFGCAHAGVTALPQSCEFNTAMQAAKSAELQKIVEADQADRAGGYESIDWSKVNPRDTERRIRVAAIFAEGCFKTAADYAAAAMVYQHGITADHYFQVFIWSNNAAKLGDSSQKKTAALGIDRYLVKIGQKQLFGTQFSKGPSGNWCQEPVELSFPDSRRLEYRLATLKDEVAMITKYLQLPENAPAIKLCDTPLKPTPAGFIPGFW